MNIIAKKRKSLQAQMVNECLSGYKPEFAVISSTAGRLGMLHVIAVKRKKNRVLRAIWLSIPLEATGYVELLLSGTPSADARQMLAVKLKVTRPFQRLMDAELAMQKGTFQPSWFYDVRMLVAKSAVLNWLMATNLIVCESVGAAPRVNFAFPNLLFKELTASPNRTLGEGVSIVLIPNNHLGAYRPSITSVNAHGMLYPPYITVKQLAYQKRYYPWLIQTPFVDGFFSARGVTAASLTQAFHSAFLSSRIIQQQAELAPRT